MLADDWVIVPVTRFLRKVDHDRMHAHLAIHMDAVPAFKRTPAIGVFEAGSALSGRFGFTHNKNTLTPFEFSYKPKMRNCLSSYFFEFDSKTTYSRKPA